MTDKQETNHAFARSLSNAGLGIPVVERDEFLAGVCVALQVITAADCSVTWAEVVRAVGEDKIIRFAALIEPDEWELAGFKKYAKNTLRRGKPRKVPNASGKGPAESRSHLTNGLEG